MQPASDSETDALLANQSFLAETHQVENQPSPLESYNLFLSDVALKQAITAHQASWAEDDLSRFGALCGSTEFIEWGFQANENEPVLYTHDRQGHRIDEVRFHPAYHQLMKVSMREGLHASHWLTQKPGAHVARAAKNFMMTQIEAGHGCPITMTSAAIPTLKHAPHLFEEWAPKVLHNHYDPRNVCYRLKESVTIGMAMTEKQGGSDVRTNSTQAFPSSRYSHDNAYELVGHKYFVSAPMCDAFLMLARTASGISCFLVPRWRPDGTKNPLQIQRLKNKMGNISNASSEIELRGALGWLVGQEGHGISTIIEMVAMTRFDCMIGSSSLMRQAVAQITHHCRQRVAFGKVLIQQPLMQNVLADLILESEAATALSFRLARALDNKETNTMEKQLVRIGTAIGKYWICKRAPGHVYEAMECIGGSGVMEDCIMPRLFRESPINTIWEGSGNVQCLDMLRAIQRNPDSLTALISEIQKAAHADPRINETLDILRKDLADHANIEFNARSIVEKMALLLQASSLFQYGDTAVAESFCRARLGTDHKGWVYGTLPDGIDCEALIKRAQPMQ